MISVIYQRNLYDYARELRDDDSKYLLNLLSAGYIKEVENCINEFFEGQPIYDDELSDYIRDDLAIDLKIMYNINAVKYMH